MLQITNIARTCRIEDDRLSGTAIEHQLRRLSDLTGVFADESARSAMDQQQVIYEVDLYLPVAPGTKGGLYWGVTQIAPGRVGDEYFMTKGHFHAQRQTAEYYWGVQGHGTLILMDEQRQCSAQAMFPGSLHYIPGHTAHRVANTGEENLVFHACWPSDAGHDYASIAREGFSARLRCLEGVAKLLPEESRP